MKNKRLPPILWGALSGAGGAWGGSGSWEQATWLNALRRPEGPGSWQVARGLGRPSHPLEVGGLGGDVLEKIFSSAVAAGAKPS